MSVYADAADDQVDIGVFGDILGAAVSFGG